MAKAGRPYKLDADKRKEALDLVDAKNRLTDLLQAIHIRIKEFCTNNNVHINTIRLIGKKKTAEIEKELADSHEPEYHDTVVREPLDVVEPAPESMLENRMVVEESQPDQFTELMGN